MPASRLLPLLALAALATALPVERALLALVGPDGPSPARGALAEDDGNGGRGQGGDGRSGGGDSRSGRDDGSSGGDERDGDDGADHGAARGLRRHGLSGSALAAPPAPPLKEHAAGRGGRDGGHMQALTIDEALGRIGVGPFHYRLLAIFGLVWAADAMQVLAIGFAAPSLALSFGLTVPQAIQAGTAFFLGMLLGAWGFGRLADRIGRRNVLVATVLIDAVFGLASAMAGSFPMLLGLRLLTGIGVGGTLPVDYAMMAEFLPPARRGRWLVALEGFWAVGTIAVALAAWALSLRGVPEAWRWLFVLTALPAVIGFFLRLWLPESPHYLARQGRGAEAQAVLDRVARGNGRPPVAGPLAATTAARGRMADLLAGSLRRRSLLVLAAWLLVSTAYYGVFIWLPGRLVTEGYGFVRGYGFLVLLALAQVPGYALAAVGVETIGRRRTLILFLIASALGCLLFVMAKAPLLIAAALLAMSFALLGTWGALYAYTPELYPTELRATGMGVAGAMARLGGLLAPSALTPVIALGFGTAIGLLAVLLAVAALAVAFIEVETRGRPLSLAA
jgi:putative MFS transporter